MSATTCPGSGRVWGTGTSNPICPVCHRGPGSLGVKRPGRRNGRFAGRLPEHETRMEWESTRRSRVQIERERLAAWLERDES